MTFSFNRRTFLRGSALAAGSTLTCTGLVRTASGQITPRVAVPEVDKLVIRVLVDGQHDIFIPEQKVPEIAIIQTRLQGGPKFKRTLLSEWGLALHLTSEKGGESKRYLLDFAYTSDVLNNNIELLGIDHAVDDHDPRPCVLVMPGERRPGFLEAHRAEMKADLPIYLGGEDAFCRRVVVLPNGNVSPFGTLDRRELEAAKLRVVTSERRSSPRATHSPPARCRARASSASCPTPA